MKKIGTINVSLHWCGEIMFFFFKHRIITILICLIGGLGGVTLGIIFGNIVTIYIGGGKFLIPWLWIIVGLLISTVVGVLSGYIPAKKAAALDPIESLRFE